MQNFVEKHTVRCFHSLIPITWEEGPQDQDQQHSEQPEQPELSVIEWAPGDVPSDV